MSRNIGMDPTAAQNAAINVSSLSAGLALVENQVRLARLMSLNPLNYVLDPGALIIAPQSIQTAAEASADIASVRQTLEYLTTLLGQEAAQQLQVSNSLRTTDPGWFAQPPTATKPDDIDPWEQEWSLWQDVTTWANYAGTAWGLVESAWKGIEAGAKKWLDDIPPWVTKGADIFSKAGKFVPWGGAVFGVSAIFTEWDNDNPWGNTRNIIGGVLGVAEVVCLIPPLTPAAPVVAAVGLVWDVFDTGWDWFGDGDTPW